MCDGMTAILSMEAGARKERRSVCAREEAAIAELRALAKLMQESWEITPVNTSGSNWVATFAGAK